LWVSYQFAKVLSSTSLPFFPFHSPLVSFSLSLFPFISAATYDSCQFSLIYWGPLRLSFPFYSQFQRFAATVSQTHSRSPRLTRLTLHCLAFVYCIAVTIAHGFLFHQLCFRTAFRTAFCPFLSWLASLLLFLTSCTLPLLMSCTIRLTKNGAVHCRIPCTFLDACVWFSACRYRITRGT